MVKRTGLPHIWHDPNGRTIWIHWPKFEGDTIKRAQFMRWVDSFLRKNLVYHN